MRSDILPCQTVKGTGRLILWSIFVISAAMSPAVACTVDAGPLVFGQIDPLAAQPTDTVATIEVMCPGPTTYSISISHPGDGRREMVSGTGKTVGYELYTDASLTIIWGDGTGGTQPVAGEAGIQGQSLDVHGRVPAQPYAIPGVYSDTLFIMISY